jgi:hypothetical protein
VERVIFIRTVKSEVLDFSGVRLTSMKMLQLSVRPEDVYPVEMLKVRFVLSHQLKPVLVMFCGYDYLLI